MGVCKHCHMYKRHGKSCWYYWENKRACSQFIRGPEDEPQVTNEDTLNEQHAINDS